MARPARWRGAWPGGSTGRARRTSSPGAGGAVFPTELSYTPFGDRGPASGAVLVFRDISERRAVERMKDEFLSVVSHELRTPLTSVRGSLGLLGSGVAGELSSQAIRMVDIAVDNTDRLIRLINDILDVERMVSGRVPLEREELRRSRSRRRGRPGRRPGGERRRRRRGGRRRRTGGCGRIPTGSSKRSRT